ncbi:PRC-barrel domain-containing protein [Deinococcus sp.]|uniref:PRC-barrel domain-containing protein n=1 Tax=Deinococcus sp. TaxID=47478 RepID=UPI0025E306C5|nr:PRC-barrel domain-containing protein [Deinococcus sp.]
MIKGKEMIGRSIMALSSGTQIDKVHDLVFDHDANQVLALLVDEGGWFRAAKVVPFEAVRSVGEDAVMIDDESHVVSARDDSRIADLLDTKIGLIGTRLLTTDGRDLGKIADVYFDEASGKVLGYEATGGLFSDLSSGRTFVPAPESISIGENAAIVPVSVATAMEEQEAGGLQGAFKSAGESISTAASTVSENVKAGYENLATATKERQKDYVVGKVAGSDVSSDDGAVIVTKGQTITEAQASLAETHGALGSLVAAATGGTMQAAYSSAAETVQSKAEDFSQASQERQTEYVVGKVAGSTVTADDGTVITHQGDTISAVQAANASRLGALGSLVASATSGSIKGRIEDLSSASRERQIEYVLGKVAGSDVHGNDESVIVLSGQVITPLAVQSAESHGALGKLVASATAGSVQSGAQYLKQSVMGSPQPASAVPASALGRRVRSDVYGAGRTLIAAQGQIVTVGVLERARSLSRETDLLRATGLGSEAASTGPAIGDQLSAGLSNVSAGASSFIDRAKQWLGEKQGDASEAIEQHQADAEAQKVRDAIGRPVNRVILDPADNIILNIGEIITNKAVNSARTAGILDMLLASVSTETVKINPLDVRPHETGKDALQGQGEVNIPKPQS